MILIYTLSIVAMVVGESTTEEQVTRNYCQLPDPIFADGIQAANFGTDGWNYANAENWEQLVVTCGGSYQSPIDIVTTGASQQQVQPQIYYKNKTSDIGYEEVNTPYTKEYEGEYSVIEVLDASGLVVRYYAKQFHIHTPSEHTIDGKHFDLEIHFVHQVKAIQDEEQDCNKVKNSLTVFGLMFTESASATDYEVFKPWFDQNMTGEVESFDLNDFFQKMTDSTYYNYNGSLTTLPCSQIVNWIVFYQALPISTFQLNQFRSTFADSTAFPLKQNNRPIQNLNGRKILKGTALTAGVTEIPDVQSSQAYLLLLSIVMGAFIL